MQKRWISNVTYDYDRYEDDDEDVNHNRRCNHEDNRQMQSNEVINKLIN